MVSLPPHISPINCLRSTGLQQRNMAHLHPFRALRPLPSDVREVACVPYDVISTAEARALAEGLPKSFLRVIRPEIDLPEGIDEHADDVYAQGAANLNAFASADYTTLDEAPSLYVYRLIMNGQAQTGIFGCVSVADYDNEVILKHELTRPVKEDDRTRHLLEQRAHAEPVMMTFKADDAVASIIADTLNTAPLYDFEAVDGVQHTVWQIADVNGLVEAFADISNLYIADGHHRCKAASRAAEALRSKGEIPGEAAFFPAVLFPMPDMRILSYNRIVKALPMSSEDLLTALEPFGLRRNVDHTAPSSPGEVCCYVDGAWHAFTLPASTRGTVADALDVARLSEYVLEPLLNITDIRRDPNIDFVGGIRGTGELEARVDRGDAVLAFSMYATSIEELVAVSDAGLLMPPKSTWFEPKLRSGLLVHLFDG